MNLLHYYLIGLCAAALVLLSGCATAPPPTQPQGPAPIYDEEGRPLWVPLPEGRTPSGKDTPPREIPPKESDREPERVPDHPAPPPRIG
ncbi:MAG: hypothetical protein ACLFQY_11310, partial [Desulfococcaceae bacterium]